MITIVCLGDSTTAGTPLFQSPIEAPPNGRGDERSQYSYWLMLQHPDWRVLNGGVNGERSDQIATRFERDVLAHVPAVVVIVAGVNDVYQGRPVAHVITHLGAMYERAAAARIPVVAGSIVPYDTATVDENARMHEINAWIAAATKRDSNLHFADTRRAAAAPGNLDRLAGSPDGLHPDIAGYRRMAEVLDPVIAKLVSGRDDAPEDDVDKVSP